MPPIRTQALGPALEALLAGPLSAEFATLCTAKPGGGGAAAGPMTYAVIKTASTTQQLQQQHLLRQESLLAATSAADTPAADADAVTGSRFAPCGLTSADTPAAGAASFYDTALMVRWAFDCGFIAHLETHEARGSWTLAFCLLHFPAGG